MEEKETMTGYWGINFGSGREQYGKKRKKITLERSFDSKGSGPNKRRDIPLEGGEN